MAKKKPIERTTSNGLEAPFPASPARPPKYGFYFRYKGGTEYYNFTAKYSAKKFLDAVLMGNEYEWVDGIYRSIGECIKDSTGLRIEGHDLEEILKYEYTSAEEEWVLPTPYHEQALRIRSAPASPIDLLSKKKSNDSEPREKREKKPKVSREGLVSIGDIAAELGMEPFDARTILRKTKTEKPAAGWAWPKDEAEAIRKLIAKNR